VEGETHGDPEAMVTTRRFNRRAQVGIAAGVAAALIAATGVGPVAAQSVEGAGADEAAASPCHTDETARAFDFWIGEWAVFREGRRAGTNTVTLLLDGCVIMENWTNVQGRQGKSFNWVDRSTYAEPRWRQLWVDDAGNTLDYADGAFRDGAMRFSGRTIDAAGDTVLQRLSFVPVHPDTVRQIFEASRDGGASWRTTWDGRYVRLPGGG
jgi:hypothetical protein